MKEITHDLNHDLSVRGQCLEYILGIYNFAMGIKVHADTISVLQFFSRQILCTSVSNDKLKGLINHSYSILLFKCFVHCVMVTIFLITY